MRKPTPPATYTTRTTPTTTTPMTSSVTYRIYPTVHPESSKEQEKEFFQWIDDNSRWCLSVTVTLSLIIQVLVPLLIWLCWVIRAWKLEKSVNEELKGAYDQQTLHSVQDRLDAFLRCHPEPVNDYSVETRCELQEIEQNFTTTALDEAEFSMQRLRAALRTPSFCRICSVYFYSSLWFWLLFVVLCEALGFTGQSQVVHTLVVVSNLVIMGLHLCVLIETYRSRERRHLVKLASAKPPKEAIGVMKAVQPEILMSAKCWHWETKTFHTSNAISRRTGYSSTKTRDVKVVTAHIVEPIVFTHWMDTSEEKDIACGGLISKVRVYTVVAPGDHQTQVYIDHQYQTFCNNNGKNDTFVELSINRGVAGVPHRYIWLNDPSCRRPWWLREAVFWVFSVLGLTWPYRLVLHGLTSHPHVVLTKRLYSVMPDSPQIPETFVPFDATHLLSHTTQENVGTNREDQNLVEMNVAEEVHTDSEYSFNEREHGV